MAILVYSLIVVSAGHEFPLAAPWSFSNQHDVTAVRGEEKESCESRLGVGVARLVIGSELKPHSTTVARGGAGMH